MNEKVLTTQEKADKEKADKALVVGQAARNFRTTCNAIATSMLGDWVGNEKAMEATGRLSTALASASASARNPADFYACTPQSIGSVIAISALTGIMPSTGGCALAYAIPRRPRQNEAPQLQYQLSHRGLAALAYRGGQSVRALPISIEDDVTADEHGDVNVMGMNFDQPPETMAQLRGILIVVRDVASGHVISRGWVSKSIILKRRDGSDAYQYAVKNEWAQKSDPWHKWPIEMAMKTGIHYAASRGWVVIDDTNSVRALSMDSDNQPPVTLEPTRPPTAPPKNLSDLTKRMQDDMADQEHGGPDKTEPNKTDKSAADQKTLDEYKQIIGRLPNAGVVRDWGDENFDVVPDDMQDEIDAYVTDLLERLNDTAS